MGSIYQDRRTASAFYFQNVINLDNRVVLIAGGRYDHYNYSGSIFSPKVSALYNFKSTKTKIKGSYGTGFRAPNFREQLLPGIGNKDLRPEESKSFDIGLEQVVGQDFMKAGITYFHIDFTDRIAFATNENHFINTEKATSRGWEYVLSIVPTDKLVFNVNYTRTFAVNKDSYEKFYGTPEYTLNFNVDYRINKGFDINMDVNSVGDRIVGFEFLGLAGRWGTLPPLTPRSICRLPTNCLKTGNR